MHELKIKTELGFSQQGVKNRAHRSKLVGEVYIVPFNPNAPNGMNNSRC